MPNVVTLGSLNLNDITTYGTISVNAPTPQADEPTRIVTLQISVGGATHNAMVANVRAIRNELSKAGAAYNATRHQEFVTLGLGLASASEVASFTVKRGWVDDLTGAFDLVTNRYGTAERPIIVTLECEAVGVGEPITDSTSGTITGGTDGWTYYREAIPGDEPAYAVLTVTDTSSSTAVLNRLHVGHLSRQELASGDFGGWYNLQAMTGATLNTSQSNAIGGDHVSRVLNVFWSWLDLAYTTAPAPLAANSGLFHVYARVRESATVPRPVQNLRIASRTSGGGLPTGNYMVVVAGWSGAVRTFLAHASEPVYFSANSAPGGITRVTLEWDAPIGYTPENYSIYWKRDGEDWKYKDAGSSSNSYTFSTEGSATTEDPPSIPRPQPARFRLRYGLESGNVMHVGPEVETRLGNDQWEMLHLGTLQLPPQTTYEGGSIQPWRLEVQAFNPASSGGRTVYADALCLIPAEHHSAMAEYESLNLATKRKWLLASDRAGGRTGLLLNTSDGSEEGHLAMRGVMRLGPGDTEIVFIPLRANGVSDVSNSRFTVGLTLYPAYRSVAGDA